MLDGLLDHKSDLCLVEDYADTSGFTNHLFAVMSLLRVQQAHPWWGIVCAFYEPYHKGQ